MKTALALIAAALLFAAPFMIPSGNTLRAQSSPPQAAPAPVPAPPQALLNKSPALPPGAAGAVSEVKNGYRYSGPYTHANLTLYLVHGADAIEASFLTLQEAFDKKIVVVHETGDVNQLAIENVSATEEIFVQGGDIVKGGRQDRVIATDFIVPKKSGRMPIGSFCVESGRWSQRGHESAGVFSSSNEQAPGKDFKLAAKKDAVQGKVWQEVGENQKKLADKLHQEVRSGQSQSSYELTLEHSLVRETAADYIKALSPAIDGKDDAIGFVFAINGKTNNADIYATHALFVKLWPKLLKAAAVEAIAEQQKNLKFEPVKDKDIRLLIEEPEKAAPSSKSVSSRVKVETKETDENILWETKDGAHQDKPVHRSIIKK